MGKTNQEIITIIPNAGRTAEKWEAARKNLGIRATLKPYDQKQPKLQWSKPERSETRESRSQSKTRRVKKDQFKSKSKGDYSKTDGIEALEIEQWKAANVYLTCAWPAHRKENHRVKDWIRPIKLDKGTASYLKAKEYQKMQVAGMELSSGEQDSESELEGSELGSQGSRSSDSEDSSWEDQESKGEYHDEEKVYEQEELEERNWWDSPTDSD